MIVRVIDLDTGRVGWDGLVATRRQREGVLPLFLTATRGPTVCTGPVLVVIETQAPLCSLHLEYQPS